MSHLLRIETTPICALTPFTSIPRSSRRVADSTYASRSMTVVRSGTRRACLGRWSSRVRPLGGLGVVPGGFVESLGPNDGDLIHKTRLVSSLGLAEMPSVLLQVVVELLAQFGRTTTDFLDDRAISGHDRTPKGKACVASQEEERSNPCSGLALPSDAPCWRSPGGDTSRAKDSPSDRTTPAPDGGRPERAASA
jgi:hypothetical protein